MRKLLFLCLLTSVLAACCKQEQIPSNIRLLSSNDAKLRNKAALDLASCGADANSAVPILGRLLYDVNVGVQSSAAYALRRIDSPEAQAILKAATEKRGQRKK